MFLWGSLSMRSILDCESLRGRVRSVALQCHLCWCLGRCVSAQAAERLPTFSPRATMPGSALLHHPLSSVLLPYPVMCDTGGAGSADGDAGVHQSEEAVPARHCRCGSHRVSGHRQPLTSSKSSSQRRDPRLSGQVELTKACLHSCVSLPLRFFLVSLKSAMIKGCREPPYPSILTDATMEKLALAKFVAQESKCEVSSDTAAIAALGGASRWTPSCSHLCPSRRPATWWCVSTAWYTGRTPWMRRWDPLPTATPLLKMQSQRMAFCTTRRAPRTWARSSGRPASWCSGGSGRRSLASFLLLPRDEEGPSHHLGG